MSTNYVAILEENCIRTNAEVADFKKLIQDVTLAVLTKFFRSERFCEGAIQGAVEDGSLRKTIERLVDMA